ncbi:MAG: hypothetical protein GY868_20375 [Deltaproteobacteria bacterium]|nr:hypothetical protein [Deltaproteobacteria bacterium]
MAHHVKRAALTLNAFFSRIIPAAEKTFTGPRSLGTCIRRFDDAILEISALKTGRITTDIIIRTRHPHTGATLNNLRLSLHDSTREIASTAVHGGQARFEHIIFGSYRVAAHINGKKIGEFILTIRE